MMQSSKKMMREFSLIRFYIILIISLIYFGAQLVVSHWAHCLTLQVNAYQSFYNILCLITCIITIRMSKSAEIGDKNKIVTEHTNSSSTSTGGLVKSNNAKGSALMNTFGWTRIDVCGTAANLCFLSALCFSVVAESLQTMLHASHHYSLTHTMMCSPNLIIVVIIVGAFGLVVNGLCVLTIGGYTFHQTSILNPEFEIGDDVHISSSVKSYVQRGIQNRRRQSLKATFRDSFGTVLVIVAGLTVYNVVDIAKLDVDAWCNGTIHNAHNITDQPDNLHQGHNLDNSETNGLIYYLDPGLCILTVVMLILLSYSYAKKAGHILLLTIPNHINVKSLEEELHKSFPEICDIHDLHVWQLTPERIICSAHIVLQKAQGYLSIRNSVTDFLHSKGISHVTLQPEFVEIQGIGDSTSPSMKQQRKCFLPCEAEDCRTKQCCDEASSEEEPHSHSHSFSGSHHGHGHGHSHSKPSTSSSFSTSTFPIKIKSDDDITPVEEAELEPMI